MPTVIMAAVTSFIVGNIFNNTIEKIFYRRERKLLKEREQKMHLQYKDMENALLVAKGYKFEVEEEAANEEK